MYLEVDPRGDTLIILQDPNSHPSSPSDPGISLPINYSNSDKLSMEQ